MGCREFGFSFKSLNEEKREKEQNMETNLYRLREMAEQAEKDAKTLTNAVKDICRLKQIEEGSIKDGNWGSIENLTHNWFLSGAVDFLGYNKNGMFVFLCEKVHGEFNFYQKIKRPNGTYEHFTVCPTHYMELPEMPK